VTTHDDDNLNRLYGARRTEALFSEQQFDKVVCPFPRAGRLKGGPGPAQAVTAEAVAGPVILTEVDPRRLWASQGFVLRQHVEYYLTDQWALTALTSADRSKVPNRFPLVWRDHRDRLVILGGHHRAAAALLEGRPLRCRIFPDSVDLQGRAVALVPRVLWGDHTDLPHVVVHTVATALAEARAGRIVLCPDRRVALDTYELLVPPPAPSHR
jgi:hypothetical protein